MDLELLERDAFDAAVAASDDIDKFCSSSDWIVPAHLAFAKERQPFVAELDGGFFAGMRAKGRAVLEPLEVAWGLACPLVGSDTRRLAASLGELLRAREQEWQLVLLTGLIEGSQRYIELVRSLGARYRLGHGLVTRRHRASLAGGVDGFLARRSHDFRKSLRKAERKVREHGITIVHAHARGSAPEELYARILAAEAQSWKGREGVGVSVPEMRVFYEHMLPRLVRHDRLRLLFAQKDGLDVGYILGGVFAGAYRGLQFSYAAALRDVGLGNVLQLTQIQALCDEGVDLYDLGTDVPYKARWGEEALDTVLLAVERRARRLEVV